MDIIRNNVTLLTAIFLWVTVGIYGGPIVYGLIVLSLILFWRAEMYSELFIGFWLILIFSDSLEPGMAWAKTIKNIYIIFLGMILYVDRKKFMPMNHIFARFIPFFVLALISLYASPTFGSGLQRTISYALIFLVAPNFITKIYRERGSVIFKELIYASILVLALGVIWWFIDPKVAVSHGTRFRGILGNPNGMGLFLVVSFLLFYASDTYYPDLFVKNEKRIFYLLLVISLLWSGSRNSLISITIFLFLVRVFKISAGVGLVVVIATFLAYQVISANLISIIQSLGLESYFRLKSLESGSGRLVAWLFAWDAIQHYFFMGRGFSYDLHLMRSNADYLSRLGHEGGVHNTYLIFWLNTGLIGLAAFFRSFFLLFIKAAKNTHLSIPTMIVVLFTISFEPWLSASLNPYTIILLVCLTLFTQEEFNTTSKPEDTPPEPLADPDHNSILSRS